MLSEQNTATHPQGFWDGVTIDNGRMSGGRFVTYEQAALERLEIKIDRLLAILDQERKG